MISKYLIGALIVVAISSFSLAQNQNSRRGGQRPPMDEATRAAFDACRTESGMPARDSGTRPTKEQHEKFKTCLTSKGVSMPEHRGHGGPGGQRPPSEESEDSQ